MSWAPLWKREFQGFTGWGGRVTGKGSDINHNMELFEGNPKCGGITVQGQ